MACAKEGVPKAWPRQKEVNETSEHAGEDAKQIIAKDVAVYEGQTGKEDQGDEDQGDGGHPAACLKGMLLRMAYKAKRYHSGTMLRWRGEWVRRAIELSWPSELAMGRFRKGCAQRCAGADQRR